MIVAQRKICLEVSHEDDDDGRDGAPLTNHVLGEGAFGRVLSFERKRAERSKRHSMLLLLDVTTPGALDTKAWDLVLETVQGSTRETDTTGWYQAGLVVGVILTELGQAADKTAQNAVAARITSVLQTALPEQWRAIRLQFHVFPCNGGNDAAEETSVSSTCASVTSRAPELASAEVAI